MTISLKFPHEEACISRVPPTEDAMHCQCSKQGRIGHLDGHGSLKAGLLDDLEHAAAEAALEPVLDGLGHMQAPHLVQE